MKAVLHKNESQYLARKIEVKSQEVAPRQDTAFASLFKGKI